MADYISREAALELIDNAPIIVGNENETLISAPKLSDEVYCLPAANVRPVVRAFWVGKMDGVGICSNCKRLDHIDPLATHCRYCGADMREPNLDTTKGDSHD